MNVEQNSRQRSPRPLREKTKKAVSAISAVNDYLSVFGRNSFMEKTLVVVESPAKAKTIKKYLGPKYEVKASVGHIKDLPAKELGVRVDEGFRPDYRIIDGKEKIVKELSAGREKHRRSFWRLTRIARARPLPGT